jgi:hypothetical protein
MSHDTQKIIAIALTTILVVCILLFVMATDSMATPVASNNMLHLATGSMNLVNSLGSLLN